MDPNEKSFRFSCGRRRTSSFRQSFPGATYKYQINLSTEMTLSGYYLTSNSASDTAARNLFNF